MAVKFRGQTFASQRALAQYLAEVTGHPVTACSMALRRLGGPDKVGDYYRGIDAQGAPVYRHDGRTFPSRRALAQHLMPIVGRSLNIVASKLMELGDDADAVAEHYRSTDDISRLGPLAQELRIAQREAGHGSMDALTVLSAKNDPYRYDHSGGRENGRWFAEVMDRFVPDGAVHLRGLHYRLVASADVRKPDGELYRNTELDWDWLQNEASAAGRWLGYVEFERIIDERNDPPLLPAEDDGIYGVSRTELVRGIGAEIPDLDDAMPEIICRLRALQPYRIVLFGEKSSLGPVLGPIRELVNGELLLPTGESTTTMVFNLAQRCAEDGRPAVIFYFSDFDPAGWQMAISVARKLQALKTLRFSDLDCQLYPVALTYEQVMRLELPSTPLKESERRADRWRAAWDHEQTEIDALAALNPAELTRIAMESIRPFFDLTLARRTQTAEEEARHTAAERLAAHPRYTDTQQAIEAALAHLEQAAGDLRAAQEAAIEAFEEVELPEVETPEPELDGEQSEPLYDSRDDYQTATERLKAHKALYESE